MMRIADSIAIVILGAIMTLKGVVVLSSIGLRIMAVATRQPLGMMTRAAVMVLVTEEAVVWEVELCLAQLNTVLMAPTWTSILVATPTAATVRLEFCSQKELSFTLHSGLVGFQVTVVAETWAVQSMQ